MKHIYKKLLGSSLFASLALLWGTGEATAASATFVFDASDTALSQLEIREYEDPYDYYGTVISHDRIQNDRLTVDIVDPFSNFSFSIPQQYSLSITGPSDLDDEEDYMIESYGSDVYVTLGTTCNGATFNVTITGGSESGGGNGDPTGEATAIFQFDVSDSVLSQLEIYQYDDPYDYYGTPISTDKIQDGKLTVNIVDPYSMFVFYAPQSSIISITGPSNLQNGIDYSIQTYLYQGQVMITPACDGATFIVTVTGGNESGGDNPGGDKPGVTFEFNGPQDALSEIQINFDGADVSSSISGNKITVTAVSPWSEIEMSLPSDFTLDIVAPSELEEDEDYAFEYSNGLSTVSAILAPSCNGYTFTVNIQQKGGSGETDTPTAIFSFEGSEAALATLEVYENMLNDLTPNISGNELKVNLGSQGSLFSFSVEDLYTISFTAPSGLTEGTDYQIQPYGSDFGYYSVDILLMPACKGSTFTVTVSKDDDDEEAGGETTYMNDGTLIWPEIEANGQVAYDNFGNKIEISYGFQPLTMISERYIPINVITPNGDKELAAGMIVDYDSSEDDENPNIIKNSIITVSLADIVMPGFPFDFDVVYGEYTFTIPTGVVKNDKGDVNPEQTFKFNLVESVVETSSVTFTFDATVLQMSQLKVYDNASGTYVQNQIVNNSLTSSFKAINTYSFTVPSQYEVTITPPADLKVNTDYLIYPGQLDDLTGIYTAIIEVYSGADGGVFNVKIKDAPKVAYMNNGSMLFPETNSKGEVPANNFFNNIGITYNLQQLYSLTGNIIPIVLINPEEEIFEINGALVAYEPGASGDPSVNPDVELPLANSMISFNIASATTRAGELILGTYTFTLPEGVVSNLLGEINPEQTFRFTIVEPEVIISTATFEFDAMPEGLASLEILDYATQDFIQDEIVNNSLTVSYIDINTYSFSVPENYEVTITGPEALEADVDYVVYPGTLDTVTGLFTTVIELYQSASGSVFTVKIVPSTITGVDAIGNPANGLYIVYDIKGFEILRTADINEFKQLASGLYIVNGKKIRISK